MHEGSVSAQQNPSTTTGISISPLRKEGSIPPGFVYSSSLLIKNNGINSQNIDLTAETFSVTNQAYDYLFKAGTTESSWVVFDRTSITLAPDETATVAYQVNVPLGTEPRGYYLALFAVNRPLASATGITPTERVASLLYLTVSGDASRFGQLISLRSPIVTFGNAGWSAALQNTGSLHYRSVYSVSVQTVFNTQLSFHEDSRLILPSSVRLIEDELEAPPVLGIYKAVYSISLGDNPAVTETRWFLYLPPLQIVLVTLIIAGLFILARRRRA